MLEYINNKTQELSLPVLNNKVNNNETFSDLRRVFTSLALAQWYKTQDHENLLFGDLIDTENITAVNVNVSYDLNYWNTQGYQKLYTATLNLPSGNFTWDWYGGLVFSEINPVITGDISYDVQNTLDDSLNKKSHNLSDIYFYSDMLVSNDPDLKPTTLYFSSATPEVNRSMNITTIIKNNGLTNASNFKIYFKYEHTFPNGYTLVDDIASETVANLGSGENTTITKTWTPYELGEFTVSIEVDGDYGVKESNELNNQRAETFVAEPSEPVVTIISPLYAAELYAYQNITFNGSAIDPQEGMLNETDLVWTSSKDGQLGTGESIYKNLSLGDHVITLTATDGKRFNGSAGVNVTVRSGVLDVIIEEPINKTYEENVSDEEINNYGKQDINIYPSELCFDCEVNENEF